MHPVGKEGRTTGVKASIRTASLSYQVYYAYSIMALVTKVTIENLFFWVWYWVSEPWSGWVGAARVDDHREVERRMDKRRGRIK